MATTIFGVLKDALARPLANVSIKLVSLKTTPNMVVGVDTEFKTNPDGSYSVEVVSGPYGVFIKFAGYEKVGEINVYNDSIPGTLEDFLTIPGVDEITPEILAQVIQARYDAINAANSAASDATAAINLQLEDQSNRFDQFLLSSGYVFLDDYENGPYTITARNQIIRYKNEFWRLNAATNPPYTTMGMNSTSWAVDVTHLVSVGDAILRADLASSENGLGASLIVDKLPYAGAVSRTQHSKNADTLSVKDFGAVGDGVTDDTAAITAWFDYVISNGKQGFLPSGRYRITSTLVILTLKSGWSIIGQGRLTSIIEMATDNVPIITFGDADNGMLHTISLLDIGLNYTNDQAGNTSANCIYFRAVNTWNIALRLKFIGGYWGIKVRAGANAPWGCNWDLLEWGSGIKGGAIDYSGSTSATPNNVWGRFGVDAKNMTEGTIFKELKGYNNFVGTIEIFGGTNNLRLMSFQAGSQFTINSLKCELIMLTGALEANSLISAPVNGVLQIGTLSISGTICVLTPSVKTYVLSSAGGSPMFVKVGFVAIEPSQEISNMYLSNLGGYAVIDYVDRYSTGFPIPYTNLGGTVASENLTISNVVNDHLSQNKGDANYTVSPGDPTNILFETPLTTVRTVTLPGEDGDLFNGMRYRIISDGAINGKNTINIASDGATRATLTVDKAFVDLMYRRHATGGAGWKVIGRGTL